MLVCQQETMCLLVTLTQEPVHGQDTILTTPRVQTVTHHEAVPGWTSGIRDLTDVLTKKSRKQSLNN